MRAGSVLVLVSAVALGAAGCAKKLDNPPRLNDGCSDAAYNNCNHPPPSGSTPPVEAGPDGAIPEAGPIDAGDAGVSLAGSLALLSSDDFVTAQPFTGTADITAEAPGGGTASATYNGQSFNIDGVLVGPSVWFSVTPTGNAGDALPTLEPWDTTSAGSVVLRLVRSSVIDQIFNVVTLPPQRDASRGQVVLHFVDQSGKAVSGVSITQSQSAGVIYDAGGTWSDTAASTGTAGFAIVVNAFPGFRQRIDLDTGAKLVYIEVQVAAGTVTLTDVPIAP